MAQSKPRDLIKYHIMPQSEEFQDQMENWLLMTIIQFIKEEKPNQPDSILKKVPPKLNNYSCAISDGNNQHQVFVITESVSFWEMLSHSSLDCFN